MGTLNKKIGLVVVLFGSIVGVSAMAEPQDEASAADAHQLNSSLEMPILSPAGSEPLPEETSYSSALPDFYFKPDWMPVRADSNFGPVLGEGTVEGGVPNGKYSASPEDKLERSLLFTPLALSTPNNSMVFMFQSVSQRPSPVVGVESALDVFRREQINLLVQAAASRKNK